MQYFNAKQYGKRIKEVREDRNITQAELAEAVGYSDARQIQRIEDGESAGSIDKLVDISQVLHISTDYLLYGQVSASNPKIADFLSDKTLEEQEFAYRILKTMFDNRELLTM